MEDFRNQTSVVPHDVNQNPTRVYISVSGDRIIKRKGRKRTFRTCQPAEMILTRRW